LTQFEKLKTNKEEDERETSFDGNSGPARMAIREDEAP
jgi:hypothetical protein